MIIQIPANQRHLYIGSGIYLAALDGDQIIDMQPINDDAAIRDFTNRYMSARIVAAIGSAHELNVAPDDCGDLRWSSEQANTIWHARDIIRKAKEEARERGL